MNQSLLVQVNLSDESSVFEPIGTNQAEAEKDLHSSEDLAGKKKNEWETA